MDAYKYVRHLVRNVHLYKAKHDDNLVVIKSIVYGHINDDDKRHLVNEVNTMRALRSHPFVTMYRGHVNCKESYTLHIISPYYPGGTLTDFAATKPGDERVLLIAAQLVRALSYCERRGVIHRDVKPDNVVLDECGQAVLIDFGLSCRAKSPEAIETQIGTPYFMSPEMVNHMFLGNVELGPKTDVWSLGVTLYAVKNNRGPFDDATTLIALVDQITHGYYVERYVKTPLYKLIRKMLTVSTRRRLFASQLEVSDASLKPYMQTSSVCVGNRETSLV